LRVAVRETKETTSSFAPALVLIWTLLPEMTRNDPNLNENWSAVKINPSGVLPVKVRVARRASLPGTEAVILPS